MALASVEIASTVQRVWSFGSAVVVGLIKIPRFTRARGPFRRGLGSITLFLHTSNLRHFGGDNSEAHCYLSSQPNPINQHCPPGGQPITGTLEAAMDVWMWVFPKFAGHPTVSLASGCTPFVAPSRLSSTLKGMSQDKTPRRNVDASSEV